MRSEDAGRVHGLTSCETLKIMGAADADVGGSVAVGVSSREDYAILVSWGKSGRQLRSFLPSRRSGTYFIPDKIFHS